MACSGGELASLSARVASLRPSKTMALTDLARALREEGKDVIGLAAGEPDFDTPEPIAAAGKAAIEDGDTRYTPNTGTAELRNAIVEKLRRENGLEYAPSDVVVTNGAKQSITQAVMAVCQPGDDVLIPAPHWVSYPEMARLAGANPVVIATTPEQGYLLSPEALESALTPASRLLILCTPSNPTGSVYSSEQLAALAEVAFAMTGWRLGYLAAPPPFAKGAAAIQSQFTSGASSISQKAGVAALALGDAGGDEVAAMVKEFRARRDYVCDRLRAMRGMELAVVPDGAFYVMPSVAALMGEGAEGIKGGFGPVCDSDTLCRYLLQEAGVALVPGDAFGCEGTLRISYAASMETLTEALDRIEEAISEENFKLADAAR
eukprot:PRCOL_00005023-RA